MKASTIIPIICVFGGIYGCMHAHANHKITSSTAAQLKGHSDQNGFVSLPVAPINMPQGKVIVVAPEHCPSPEGRRGDALEQLLANAGIPCVRTENVQYPPVAESGSPVITTIMNGALPIVFINGKAQNNPDVSKIIAEFRSLGTKSKTY
jgi:hypothetical protein